MIEKCFLTFILVLAAVNLQCNGKVIENPKLSDLGTTSVINEYVDRIIEMVVPQMEEKGLEPMTNLPEVVEGFDVHALHKENPAEQCCQLGSSGVPRVSDDLPKNDEILSLLGEWSVSIETQQVLEKFLLINYSAWLKIHEGYMTGLSNVTRSGDQTVSYYMNMLRARIEVQFTDLEVFYKYLIQVMNIGPKGGIVGCLDKLVAELDILLDSANDEVHLQRFSFEEIGRLRVRFTGNILTDWLVNPVVGVFVRIFDTIIIKAVETNLHTTVQQLIKDLNQYISNGP